MARMTERTPRSHQREDREGDRREEAHLVEVVCHPVARRAAAHPEARTAPADREAKGEALADPGGTVVDQAAHMDLAARTDPVARMDRADRTAPADQEVREAALADLEGREADQAARMAREALGDPETLADQEGRAVQEVREVQEGTVSEADRMTSLTS